MANKEKNIETENDRRWNDIMEYYYSFNNFRSSNHMDMLVIGFCLRLYLGNTFMA
jgi:hypothetical protein